jgi:uncharacterized protein YbjQ (UPF0145 family)
MERYYDKKVPNVHTTSLGRIKARETAARIQTAERVAIQQLEKQARKKGANAIVDFSTSSRRTFDGFEFIAAGEAVRLSRK